MLSIMHAVHACTSVRYVYCNVLIKCACCRLLAVLTLRAQSCGADRLDAVKGKNRPVEGTLILRCCLADDLTKRGIEHYWTLNGSMRCNSRDTHQLDDRIKCIKFELVPNYGYCNVLVVSSLRYEDAGLYDCHADGKSVNVTISVHSKVSPPTGKTSLATTSLDNVN